MFYVAMTRAKDKLTLLSPKTRNSVEVDSSQFLKDIIEIENNLKTSCNFTASFVIYKLPTRSIPGFKVS